MITLLTATPGGGKTNYAVWDVIKPARESGRTVYTNGIPDLKIPTIEVDRNQLKQWAQRTPVDPEKPEGIQVLDNFEEGSLIVADEVLYLWPSLNYKLPPEDIAYLTQHRKHGLDFFLISQDPGLIHPLVLKNVDRHMHIVHEWQGRFIYEWPEYCSNPKVKTNKQLAVKKRYNIEKKAFSLYYSASVHVPKSKRAIPKMVYISLIVLLALPVVSYAVYNRVVNNILGDQVAVVPESVEQENSEEISVIDLSAATATSTVSSFSTNSSYYPINVLRADIDWSTVSACLLSEKQCICYGFFSERLMVPKESCELAAKHGWTGRKSSIQESST